MTTITLQPYPGRGVRPSRRVPVRRSELRLTHRGRVLVIAATVLIAFVVGAFVSAAHSVATEHPGTPSPTRIVRVHQGDTLWDIAAGLDQGDDVRATMAAIERLNAMSDTQVWAGQRLVVPAG